MKTKIIIWSAIGISVVALALSTIAFIGNNAATFPFFLDAGGGQNKRLGECEDWGYDANGKASASTNKNVTRTKCASTVTKPWEVFIPPTTIKFDQWCNNVTGACKKCQTPYGCNF